MKNKTIILAVAGLVVGGVVGALANTEAMDIYSMAVAGGIVGFLVGWVLQSRDKSSD